MTGFRFRMPSKMLADVSPLKRQNTSRHFVEHGAEGKKIRTGIEFLALRLFRRHVGDGSNCGARAGQILHCRSCGWSGGKVFWLWRDLG